MDGKSRQDDGIGRSAPIGGQRGKVKAAARVNRLDFEALEPRILLSADVAALAELARQVEQTQVQSLEVQAENLAPEPVIAEDILSPADELLGVASAKDGTTGTADPVVLAALGAHSNGPQLVIIDTALDDYESLIDALVDSGSVQADALRFDLSVAEPLAPLRVLQGDAGSDESQQDIRQRLVPPAGSSIVLLDGRQDGVAQLTEFLSGLEGVSALHILSHGDAAELHLGSAVLDPTGLDNYQSQLGSWGEALSADGDILLYACNLGQDAQGVLLLNKLSHLTQADIAASVDATGGVFGNWKLELATGQIEAAGLTAQGYQHSLLAITNASSSIDFPAQTIGPVATVTADGPVARWGVDWLSQDASKFRIDNDGKLYFSDNLAGISDRTQLTAQQGSGPYSITVEAYADPFDSSPSATKSFTINVVANDGSNQRPLIVLEDPYGGQELHGTTQETMVGEHDSGTVALLAFRDFDGGVPMITLADVDGKTDKDQFSFDPVSGRLSMAAPPSFATFSNPDGRNGTPYEVRLIATDAAGASAFVNYKVGIAEAQSNFQISGWSDFLGSNPTQGSIGFISGATSSVTTLQTANASGAVNYFLSGPDAARFTLDAAGVLSFAATPDVGAPVDANRDNLYHLEIRASDENFNGDAVFLTVRVSQPPVITSNGSFTLEAGTTAVGTITATDPQGDTPVYGIAGGTHADLFAINSASGDLSFKVAPSYSSSGSNSYQVSVSVKDAAAGGLTVTQDVTVAVTQSNQSPVISTTTLSAAENQLAAGTVSASDADGDTLTYSISGGSEAALFEIEPGTGALQFKAAPDFELPAGTNLSNNYQVEVTVSDGHGGSGVQTIVVSVTDANDPPVIGMVQNGTFVPRSEISLSVLDNKQESLAEIGFADQDGIFPDNYSWALGGADAALFTLTKTSGGWAKLAFKDALAYNSAADANGDNVFDLTLNVTEAGGATSATVAVHISQTRVNTAPSIASVDRNHLWYDNLNGGSGLPWWGDHQRILVPYQHPFITRFTGSDIEGDAISWSIPDATQATLFGIDASTGELRSVATAGLPHDFNANQSGVNEPYTLTVRATDALGKWTEKTVEILVDRNNTQRPSLSGTFSGIEIGELSTDAGSTVTSLPVVMGTGFYLPSTTMSLSGEDAALFQLVGDGPVRLTTRAALDFENPADSGQDNQYRLTVSANVANYRLYQDVSLNITDDSEVAPHAWQQLVEAMDYYTGRAINPDHVTGDGTPGYVYGNLDGNFALLEIPITSATSQTDTYQLLEIVREAIVHTSLLNVSPDNMGSRIAAAVRSAWAAHHEGNDKWLDDSAAAGVDLNAVASGLNGHIVDPVFYTGINGSTGKLEFSIEVELYQYLAATHVVGTEASNGVSMDGYLASFSQARDAAGWKALLAGGTADAATRVRFDLHGEIDLDMPSGDVVTIQPKRDFATNALLAASGLEVETRLANVSNPATTTFEILGGNSVAFTEDLSSLQGAVIRLRPAQYYNDFSHDALLASSLGHAYEVSGHHRVNVFGDDVKLGDVTDGLDTTAWEAAHLGDLQQTARVLGQGLTLLADGYAHGGQQGHLVDIGSLFLGPYVSNQSIDEYAADSATTAIDWQTLKLQLLAVLDADGSASGNRLNDWLDWYATLKTALPGAINVLLPTAGGAQVDLSLQRSKNISGHLNLNLARDLGLELPLPSSGFVVSTFVASTAGSLDLAGTLTQDLTLRAQAGAEGVTLADNARISTRLTASQTGSLAATAAVYAVGSDSPWTPPGASQALGFVMKNGSVSLDYTMRSDLADKTGGYAGTELAAAISALADLGSEQASPLVQQAQTTSGRLAFDLYAADGTTPLGDAHGAVSANFATPANAGIGLASVSGLSDDDVARPLGLFSSTAQLRDELLRSLDLFTGRQDTETGYDFTNLKPGIAYANEDFETLTNQALNRIFSALYTSLLAFDTGANPHDHLALVNAGNQALQALDFLADDGQYLRLVDDHAGMTGARLDLQSSFTGDATLDLGGLCADMKIVQDWGNEEIAQALQAVAVSISANLRVQFGNKAYYDPVQGRYTRALVDPASGMGVEAHFSDPTGTTATAPSNGAPVIDITATVVDLDATTTLSTGYGSSYEIDAFARSSMPLVKELAGSGSASATFSEHANGSNTGILAGTGSVSGHQQTWTITSNTADQVYYDSMLATIRSGMETMFDGMKDSIRSELGQVALPMVGDKLAVPVSNLFDTLKDELLGVVGADEDFDPIVALESQIYKGLKDYLRVLVDANYDGNPDVGGTHQGVFDLEAISATDAADFAQNYDIVDYVRNDRDEIIGIRADVILAKDIALGGLDLDFNDMMGNVLPITAKAGFDLDLSAMVRLGFGWDLDNGFYVVTEGITDEGDDLALALTASLRDGTEVGADIGLLRGSVKGDSNDKLTGILGIDLSGKGDGDFDPDGDAGVWNVTGQYKEGLDIAATARLVLEAELDADISAASLLSVHTGILIEGDWKASFGAQGSESFDFISPDVTLTNVTLGLGDLGSKVLQPVAEQIGKYLEPMAPIVDALGQELEFLPPDMNTVAKFLDKLAELKKKPAYFQKFVDIYKAFDGLREKVAQLDGSGDLVLGDFVLNDHAIEDAREFVDSYVALFDRLNTADEGEDPVLSLDQYNQNMVDVLFQEFDARKNSELFDAAGSAAAGNRSNYLAGQITLGLDAFDALNQFADFTLGEDMDGNVLGSADKDQAVLHGQINRLQVLLSAIDWEALGGYLGGEFSDYLDGIDGHDSDPSAEAISAMQEGVAGLLAYIEAQGLDSKDSAGEYTTAITTAHVAALKADLSKLGGAVTQAIAPTELAGLVKADMGALHELYVKAQAALDAVETDTNNQDTTGGKGESDQKKKDYEAKLKTASSGGQFKFSVPLIEGFTPIYNLLTNKTTDLVTLTMEEPLVFGAEAEIKIPLYPPILYAKLGGEFSAELRLGFGLDTAGFLEWKETGYDVNHIGDIFLKGLYVSDNVHWVDGGEIGAPLLNGQTYTNWDISNKIAEDLTELTLGLQITAGASVGIGGLVEVGVEGGIKATAEFDLNDKPAQAADLNDPTEVYDGKLYLVEIADIITEHGIECLFDVDAQANAFLNAFIWVGVDMGFYKATLFEQDFEFLDVELFSVHHHCGLGERPYKLADLDEETGELKLAYYQTEKDYNDHVSYGGPYAYQVDYEENSIHYWHGEKVAEETNWVVVRGAGFAEYFLASEVKSITTVGSDKGDRFHLQENLDNIDHALNVVLETGAGDDMVRLDATSSLIVRKVITGSGNDMVRGSDGNDDIDAGAGYDVVIARAGDDTVHGGDDDDRIVAGLGNDWIYGDAGNDQLYLDAGDDPEYEGPAGTNRVWGGSGDDNFIWTTDNGVLADQEVHGGDGNDHLLIQSLRGVATENVVEVRQGSDAVDGRYVQVNWGDGQSVGHVRLTASSSIEDLALHTSDGADQITVGDLSDTADIVASLHIDSGNTLDVSRGYAVVDPDESMDRLIVEGTADDDFLTMRYTAPLLNSEVEGQQSDGNDGGDLESEAAPTTDSTEQIVFKVPTLELSYDSSFSNFEEPARVGDHDFKLLAGAGGTAAGSVAEPVSRGNLNVIYDTQYTLTGGSDKFVIDAATGKISFKQAPTSADAGVYSVDVKIERVRLVSRPDGIEQQAVEAKTVKVGIQAGDRIEADDAKLQKMFADAKLKPDVIGYLLTGSNPVVKYLDLSNYEPLASQIVAGKTFHAVSYELVEGADAGLFALDAKTGELRFKANAQFDATNLSNNYKEVTVNQIGYEAHREVGSDGKVKVTIVDAVQSKTVLVHIIRASQVSFAYVGGEHLQIKGEGGNDVIDLRPLKDKDVFDASVAASAKPVAKIDIYGGAGNDTLYGSEFGEHIDGGLGDDRVTGGWGNDSYSDVGGTDTFFEVRLEGHNRMLASDDTFMADVSIPYKKDGVSLEFASSETESLGGVFERLELTTGSGEDELGTIGWSQDAVLDGGGDADLYRVELDPSGGRDTVIRINDSGIDAGRDTLLVFGTENEDAMTSGIEETGMGYIASHETATFDIVKPSLDGNLDTSSRQLAGTTDDHSQRVFYGASPDSYLGAEEIIVDLRGGNDTFVAYDNTRSLSVLGGAGNDSIIIGVITKVTTVPNPYFPNDRARDLQVVDIGGISNGVSVTSAFYGGSGGDYFEVNHNAASIELYGESGNDLFYVQAHLIVTGVDSDGKKTTEVVSGKSDMRLNLSEMNADGNTPEGVTEENGGADTVLNQLDTVKNGKVAIDGGSGLDSLAIGGTPMDDTFYIYTEEVTQEDGSVQRILRLYGAGLQLEKVKNVERIVLVTGGGDDTVYVNGLNAENWVEIYTGAGNDHVYVGGEARSFETIIPPATETFNVDIPTKVFAGDPNKLGSNWATSYSSNGEDLRAGLDNAFFDYARGYLESYFDADIYYDRHLSKWVEPDRTKWWQGGYVRLPGEDGYRDGTYNYYQQHITQQIWLDLQVDRYNWNFATTATFDAQAPHRIQLKFTTGQSTVQTLTMPKGGLADIQGTLVLRDRTGNDSVEILGTGSNLSMLHADITSGGYDLVDPATPSTGAYVRDATFAGLYGIASPLLPIINQSENRAEYGTDFAGEVMGQLEVLNAKYNGTLMQQIAGGSWKEEAYRSAYSYVDANGNYLPRLSLPEGDRIIFQGTLHGVMWNMLKDYRPIAPPPALTQPADSLVLLLPALEPVVAGVAINYEQGTLHEQTLTDTLTHNKEGKASNHGSFTTINELPDSPPKQTLETTLEEQALYAFGNIAGGKEAGRGYNDMRDLLNAINAQLAQYNLRFDGQDLRDLVPYDFYFIYKQFDEVVAEDGSVTRSLREGTLLQVKDGVTQALRHWNVADGYDLDKMVAEAQRDYKATLAGRQYDLETRDARLANVRGDLEQWYQLNPYSVSGWEKQSSTPEPITVSDSTLLLDVGVIELPPQSSAQGMRSVGFTFQASARDVTENSYLTGGFTHGGELAVRINGTNYFVSLDNYGYGQFVVDIPTSLHEVKATVTDFQFRGFQTSTAGAYAIALSTAVAPGANTARALSEALGEKWAATALGRNGELEYYGQPNGWNVPASMPQYLKVVELTDANGVKTGKVQVHAVGALQVSVDKSIFAGPVTAGEFEGGIDVFSAASPDILRAGSMIPNGVRVDGLDTVTVRYAGDASTELQGHFSGALDYGNINLDIDHFKSINFTSQDFSFENFTLKANDVAATSVNVDFSSAKGNTFTFESAASTVLLAPDVTSSHITVTGTGSAKITGGAGADVIRTAGGNDEIHGGGGDDDIDAGAGNDNVSGDAGNDLIHGGDGDDRISGSAGNDRLYGGRGADRLEGDAGDDYLENGMYMSGGAGDDQIIAGEDFGNLWGLISGDDWLQPGSSEYGHRYGWQAGNDRITVRTGSYLSMGGEGDDVIDVAASGKDQVIFGDNGLITMPSDQWWYPTEIASRGAVSPHLLELAVEIRSIPRGGDDRIILGSGRELVIGGGGSDTVEAGVDGQPDILFGDYAGKSDASEVLHNTTPANLLLSNNLPVTDKDDLIFHYAGATNPDVDYHSALAQAALMREIEAMQKQASDAKTAYSAAVEAEREANSQAFRLENELRSWNYDGKVEHLSALNTMIDKVTGTFDKILKGETIGSQYSPDVVNAGIRGFSDTASHIQVQRDASGQVTSVTVQADNTVNGLSYGLVQFGQANIGNAEEVKALRDRLISKARTQISEIENRLDNALKQVGSSLAELRATGDLSAQQAVLDSLRQKVLKSDGSSPDAPAAIQQQKQAQDARAAAESKLADIEAKLAAKRREAEQQLQDKLRKAISGPQSDASDFLSDESGTVLSRSEEIEAGIALAGMAGMGGRRWKFGDAAVTVDRGRTGLRENSYRWRGGRLRRDVAAVDCQDECAAGRPG